MINALTKFTIIIGKCNLIRFKILGYWLTIFEIDLIFYTHECLFEIIQLLNTKWARRFLVLPHFWALWLDGDDIDEVKRWTHCYNAYIPSASHKCLLEIRIFIPDCPHGLKNWPYSPLLYRLLEVNIEKNDRMSIKEAQSIPIFPFLCYLFAGP